MACDGVGWGEAAGGTEIVLVVIFFGVVVGVIDAFGGIGEVLDLGGFEIQRFPLVTSGYLHSPLWGLLVVVVGPEGS